ncbi:cobaltochelatase subunit CobS [Shewanella sp. Choline-02u-19]|jgi:cobaltochelatase CobS|uniref:AAA family ATPase n=1 Tax=unclassified Shewanella TaxID=196818 RepID=UPI000C33A7E0|nr:MULTISPECIES: MoxR family ATPase [unclassified Shewanella]PKG72833.1 cobaltochelatase subunit CobS [Shewanella sp. GutCb]PKH57304.1 cobaltochelatase subunit CobS [Shewanella sp. Bg11-22]PKI29582.1 cobaltochelatase subunit CobS [Shewanella sp. Choline-02u-19]
MTDERVNEPIALSAKVEVCVRDVFNIDSDLIVTGYREPNAYVPEIDAGYHFNKEVTLAILAGFEHNRRVMLQGMHGTGKSTHIEQVAARLNWPCVRVNLDGNISRLDLVGKDTIVIKDGKQVTEFQEGILPWSIQRPIALIFDEYDAGRPDVMFVIQRILERDGKLTLLDKNRVISPHADFRLFATANTIGQGDYSGLYRGVQVLNHAQIDRWNILAALNYLPQAEEVSMVLDQVTNFKKEYKNLVDSMVSLANLTRQGFMAGEISTLMSPRTVITWAENTQIFDDINLAFKLSFLNKCEAQEKELVAEYFQRCFGQEFILTE